MKLRIFPKSLFIIVVTLLSMVLSSCDPVVPDGQVTYMAKLVNVNWNNKEATQRQLQGVQVIRNNQRIQTQYNMHLYSGDRIITNSVTTVFLIYREGSEVMINRDTDVLLKNPIFKIFLHLGEVFLDVQSRFEVIDEFGSVINDGTQYLVSKRGSRLKVAVIEGRVSVNSSLEAKPNWSGILLTKRQKVTRTNARNLTNIRRINNKEYRRIKRWTQPLKRIPPRREVPPKDVPAKKEDTSRSPVPEIFTGLIIGIFKNRNKKRDSGTNQQPDNTQPGTTQPETPSDDVPTGATEQQPPLLK